MLLCCENIKYAHTSAVYISIYTYASLLYTYQYTCVYIKRDMVCKGEREARGGSRDIVVVVYVGSVMCIVYVGSFMCIVYVGSVMCIVYVGATMSLFLSIYFQQIQ